ncbi:MAG: asparagine synthase (glutamine-hydrolyzing) [Planctomycetota bacterium]
MCGIAGIMMGDRHAARERIRNMNAAQRHRGPNDEGFEELPAGEQLLILAHRRLSIQDLSAAGHQPMHNPDTGDWIIFNGEIYNFKALRLDLEKLGERFQSQCDTEVILKAFARWGMSSFEKLNGMFAFALFSAATQELFLVRDPLGIKPLYYSWHKGAFGFASEVRALKAGRLVSGEIDRRAVAGMVAYGAVQEPLTLYKEAKALPPGTWAVLDLNSNRQSFARTGRHWDFPVASEPAGGREAALESLREILTDACTSHLVSDVPVGVFLSSGIDSNAIAAVCSKAHKDIDTFSLRLSDQPELDESSEAARSAGALGLRHHIMDVTDAEVCGQTCAWMASQDQPSMDGLNTFVISKAVRSHGIVVALSGLGGDELFAGYPSFKVVPQMIGWRERTQFLPSSLLQFGVKVAFLGRAPSSQRKIADTITTPPTTSAMYFRKKRLTSDSEMRDLGFDARELNLTPEFMPPECEPERGLPAHDSAAALSILESRFYMGNTLLRDSDSCSMAHGLELRVPLLDRRILDFAYSIPGQMRMDKTHSAMNKPMLAGALNGILPPRILGLKKRGFNLSQSRWMHGPLSGVFEDGISALKRSTLTDSKTVGTLWNNFQKSNQGFDWARLWTMGVLGSWCEFNQKYAV